jgi:DNA topoisomerase-1
MKTKRHAAEEDMRTADPEAAAVSIGLTHVSDAEPGFIRKRTGKNFVYVDHTGGKVRNKSILARIRLLAIPPAWTDVWICRSAIGHLQATGRDARGRKQYLYHPDFREQRETSKYERLDLFARSLPVIRKKVRQDMNLRGLPREKILATIVYLLETTLIRIGNSDYAKSNHSYGLTTLRNRHANVNGAEVRFRFIGKSGKVWSLAIKDRRIAKIIRECHELPGQELLQYLDESGAAQTINSTDVNEYLKAASGLEITAKDFRTWAGTVLAVQALSAQDTSEPGKQAKANLKAAIARVASLLGNTTAVCRKCYVHPRIAGLYLAGKLASRLEKKRRKIAGLSPQECAALALIRDRRASI